MNKDHLKLGLLALCWLLCLGTLFTSPTITQGNPDMGQLKTNTIEACTVPRRKRNECLKNNKASSSSSSCDGYEYNLKKCERAVKRAYQHINLGGCPFEIKSSNLCDAEWCQGGGGSNFESCQKECSGVRESLSSCIHKQILSYFNRFGLTEDGTSISSS